MNAGGERTWSGGTAQRGGSENLPIFGLTTNGSNTLSASVSQSSIAVQPARRRLDGLDGLRGIAVLLVVLFHGGVLPFGWIGVNLFFCLSGFLITRILLDAKAANSGTRSILVPFYVRRALRILPLATLVALITALATNSGWSTLWYVTYLVNWMPFPPPPRELGHYWTLAVEEQFYLLWPLAVLLISPKGSLKLVVTLFVVCSVARALLIWLPLSFATPHFLGNATIARADPILIGAALALGTRNGLDGTQRWRRISIAVLLLSFVMYAGLEYLRGFHWHPWAPKTAYIFVEPFLALAFGASLLFVLLTPPSWLRWRWLEQVGRISYGVYVIHGCLSPWLRTNIADATARTAILLSMSLALAAISWRLFESPLLSFKDRWPMPSARVARSTLNCGQNSARA